MITVDGEEVAWAEGLTVSDILKTVEDGDKIAVVRVNDQVVSRPNFESTVVPDQAEVLLIPMIAGG